MKHIILGAIILIFLGACGTSEALSPREVKYPIEDSVYYDDFVADSSSFFYGMDSTNEKSTKYNSSRKKFIDLVHTKIEAQFNWNESTMRSKASLTLKPHFYATDSVELDAKGMEIISVSMNKLALSYRYNEAKKLLIRLGKIFKKDEQFIIEIEYVAKPEERILGGSSAISSDKGLFFINPKGELKDVMPQIWTQGETEANSVWFPTLDAPNSKSSQEIILTVEDKYVTLSNGKLINSKKNSDGTRTDHWKQDLPHAPYLFMMAVGEFKIVTDSYMRKDGKKIDVNYYVEPEFEKDAKSIFGKTPKMIKYFSEKLGVEYPWDKYSQIVVRDYVSGAMENTGAVVFGDFVYKTKRELIDGNDESTIAHELFHHWFGDLVTCESWANLPLNESFANYAQYLWDEYEYGRDEADYNAEDEASGYYSSYTYNNLIRYEYADKEDMFDSHSYNKGGRILHMLRNYLGDEAFFAGLNRYLTVNSYKSAEIHDLRLAMEEVSGEDLNWFFNQWFLSNGHPVLFTEQSIDKVNKTVTISVKQAQSFPAFKLPINVALWDEDGKHIYPIVIENLDESFTFPYIGTVKNVHLDDDQMLLAKVYEDKPIDQLVHQYYNATRYRSKATALKRISTSNLPDKMPIYLHATSSNFWGLRLSGLRNMASIENLAEQKEFESSLLNIIKNDKKSTVRKEAIGLLSAIDKTTAIKTVREILSRDSSLLVLGASMNTLKEIDSAQALSFAREFKTSEEAELQVSSAEIIGALGEPKDLPFLEELVLEGKLQGYNKMRALLAYAIYVIKYGTESMDNAYKVLVYSKNNGNTYTGWYFEMIVERFMEILQAELENITQEISLLNKNKDNAQIEALEKKRSKLEATYNSLSPMIEARR